jgi:rubrerythrin
MGNIFSGSEIVELGVQIEKNGKDFYETLLKKSKNQKTQEIFKYLAGEEEKHIQVFQKILEKIQNYEPPESYPGEYFAYMNALASEYVFTQKGKGEEIAQKTKSDLEAIELGMGFEKDSIIFYEGMKKVTPSYDQKIIDELIAQEQNHLRQLIELKASIKGG